MNTILIAGAGQLGSRHLQGVKRSNHELDIWVYDLSEESLKIAKERYDQIEMTTEKSVHFVTSLDSVPTEIDVVIVASGSKPRAIIVKQILAAKHVRYMVLEKFLFTRLAEYDEIGALIREKGIKTWVNCTRRMLDIYNYVRKNIDSTKPIEFIYEGQNWGLCCNSIHFIDMLMCLSGEDDYSIDLNDIDKEIIESKRKGYIELIGTEIITTPKGNKLILSSLKEFKGNAKSTIKNGEKVIEIFEGEELVVIDGVSKPISLQYQSELSGILVDVLLETSNCPLTPYNLSAKYHMQFLNSILSFVNKLKGVDSDSCPIT